MSKTWIPIAFLFGEAIAFAVSGGAVAIVLSRWGGTALLGEYSLVLAWIAVFQALANFGLTELTMRELGRVADTHGKQISHSLLIGVAASAICMVLMAGIVLFVSYPENMRHALFLGVLLLAPMTVSSICRACFLAHDKPRYVFLVAIVEAVLGGGINCYLAIEGHGVVAFIATMLGVKLLTSVLSLVFLKRDVPRLRPDFDAAFLRGLLSTLLTFGVGSVLGTLSMRINLILLSAWAAIHTVGLYAAATKVLELSLIVPAIFAQALLPRLARSFAQRNALEVKALLAAALPWMTGIVVALASAIAVFAPQLLQLLFGADFVEASTILRILMIFLVVESIDTVMSITLKAAGLERLDIRLFAGNVVVNMGASLLLISGWGGLGCAFAKICGGLASGIPRCAASLRMANEVGMASKPSP